MGVSLVYHLNCRSFGGDILKEIRIVFLVLVIVLAMKTILAATPGHVRTNESSSEATPTMQENVTAEGVIQKQGMTTYQYGTHVLKDSNKKTLYALTSKSEKLDTYVGKQVKITGTLIPDYPVDGGPKYVEVTSVEVIK